MSHWLGHIVEIRRGRHHRFVDLGELLLGTATLDADDVAQSLVARPNGGIDSKEATEVDLTISFDLQAFEGDSRTAHCATYPTVIQALSAANRCSCGLANWFDPPSSQGSSISIENRRDTCCRRSRSPRRANGFAFGLPGRGDAPGSLAFCSVSPDAVDQGKQVVDVDAVDNFRLGGRGFGNDSLLAWMTVLGWTIGAWRARPECAHPGFG